MSILGIIGGTGPESTIDYYRRVVASCRASRKDGRYPPILINSIDMKKMLDLIGAGELSATAVYLLGEVERLAAAGAGLGIFAANTPHIVFEEIERQSPIPLISIVEATCEAAKALGLRKAGLFGTRFTMQGGFYSDVFGRAGMEIILPKIEEQEYIHEKYFSELTEGVFLPETRARLLRIANRLREDERIDALILAGTELPLILREPSHGGVPFLDTTEIHVRAAVAWILAQ